MPFEVAFPVGAYIISEVEPVVDYERSSKDNKIQSVDPDTGLLLWQVSCLDADPEAKKSAKTVTVKIPAKVQPVPPENKDGSPFTPVVFDGLTALPWIEESGNFTKISWSFKAEAMRAPAGGKASGERQSGAEKTVGEKASGERSAA